MMRGFKAPNVSGLPPPRTPQAVRHDAYPLEAPRITPLKIPTRNYSKQPAVTKTPAPSVSPMMGMPILGGS